MKEITVTRKLFDPGGPQGDFSEKKNGYCAGEKLRGPSLLNFLKTKFSHRIVIKFEV